MGRAVAKDGVRSSTSSSAWHRCFACASDTVLITGQPVANPALHMHLGGSGDNELTGAKGDQQGRRAVRAAPALHRHGGPGAATRSRRTGPEESCESERGSWTSPQARQSLLVRLLLRALAGPKDQPDGGSRRRPSGPVVRDQQVCRSALLTRDQAMWTDPRNCGLCEVGFLV